MKRSGGIEDAHQSSPAYQQFLPPRKLDPLQTDGHDIALTGHHQFQPAPRFTQPSSSRHQLSAQSGYEASLSRTVSLSSLRPCAPLPTSPVGEVVIQLSGHDNWHGHSPNPVHRLPKRQRISISPEIENERLHPVPDRYQLSPGESNGDDTPSDSDADEKLGAQADDQSTVRWHQAEGSRAQPVFSRPPKFQANEASVRSAASGPDLFSPRGGSAKYLAGGLATEVQGWLSAVKTGESTTVTLQVRVDKATRNEAMLVLDGSCSTAMGPGAVGPSPLKVILPNPELSRAESNRVGSGCDLRLEHPSWDIGLGTEDVWVVASEWSA